MFSAVHSPMLRRETYNAVMSAGPMASSNFDRSDPFPNGHVMEPGCKRCEAGGVMARAHVMFSGT